MFCKNCGKEIRDDSQFCWNCGLKIEIKKEDTVVEESLKKTYCKSCGEEIYERADTCPHCGIRLRIVTIKNPGVSAILSFFIPGLGQIYNGEIAIGIAFLIIDILLLGIGVSLIRSQKIMEGAIFIIVTLAFWIFNIYNTYKVSEKINMRQY